jgi:tetratricopeptide (TPR) repeat protein
MKAPFLTELAIVYFYQEDFERALDTAEEGYALAKVKPTIIALQYHAMIAARYARNVGNYQRALEILDEIENLYRIKNMYLSSYSQVQLMTERLRLLYELKPQRIQEAVEISRNILHLLSGISTTRALVEAYCETGKTYLYAKMYDKSLDALKKVQEIGLNNNNGYHKKFLLRKGRECYQDCLTIIKTDPDLSASNIHLQISRWLDEIKRVYSV